MLCGLAPRFSSLKLFLVGVSSGDMHPAHRLPLDYTKTEGGALLCNIICHSEGISLSTASTTKHLACVIRGREQGVNGWVNVQMKSTTSTMATPSLVNACSTRTELWVHKCGMLTGIASNSHQALAKTPFFVFLDIYTWGFTGTARKMNNIL